MTQMMLRWECAHVSTTLEAPFGAGIPKGFREFESGRFRVPLCSCCPFCTSVCLNTPWVQSVNSKHSNHFTQVEAKQSPWFQDVPRNPCALALNHFQAVLSFFSSSSWSFAAARIEPLACEARKSPWMPPRSSKIMANEERAFLSAYMDRSRLSTENFPYWQLEGKHSPHTAPHTAA